MSLEKISINPPIDKNYLMTFMSNYIQLKYFEDKTISLDSLKNLIFPPNYLENDFQNFVDFVNKISFQVINKSLKLDEIESELKNDGKYQYKSDQLTLIFEVLTKKKTIIHNNINRSLNYNSERCELKDLSWLIKTVLSGSDESNIYQERYCDLELNLTKNDENEKKNNQLNLTLLKDDVLKLQRELNKVKKNLVKIKEVTTKKNE
jgi:hypothetical protein